MANKDAFARACVELFSRLWLRLESISSASCSHCIRANGAFEHGAQIIRLELIVLLDACRTTRWRMLLDDAQRRELEQCVREVLDCLDAKLEEAPLQTIERAQNCLLDAVLEHAGVLGPSHHELPAPSRRSLLQDGLARQMQASS